MYDQQPISLKSSTMSQKISDVRLEPADNGVILSWTERKESKSKNTYDNCTWDYKKELFEGDANSADAMASAFDDAMPRFKELWKQQYSK